MKVDIKKLDEKSFDDFFVILNSMSLWADMGEMSADHKKRLHDDYFAAKPKFECLIAYADNKPVAFLSFFNTYGTLTARSAMYIEDMYVMDDYQSKGVGKAMINESLKIAKERGHARVDLLSFGNRPRKFYEKIGAKWKDQHFHYRFYEDLIKNGVD